MEELSELGSGPASRPGEGDAEIHVVEKEEEFIPPRGGGGETRNGVPIRVKPMGMKMRGSCASLCFRPKRGRA
jgi:hypothetical protein